RLRRLGEGRSARPAAGTAGPLPSDELAVPPEHGLGRHEEGAPGVPCQVVARRSEEEAVAPTDPRPAGLPTEHLKLVAKDHDFQVLGVLVAPHEPSEDSAEDQGHERPHHEGPPAADRLPDTTAPTRR